MSMMPKVIHYCWFGGKPLPKSARKCIESWKRYLPDYEIREWNEYNFDVNIIPYTCKAYECGNYAFVSDYVRFYVLYHHGGLYFDTDVEAIRPLDDIVARGAFMGIEQDGALISVNPGLGMGAEPHNELYRHIMKHYESLCFDDESQPSGIVVKATTEILTLHGFKHENTMQNIGGMFIYPNDWFNPLDDATGRITITGNTRSIHRYSKTWVENYGPVRIWLTRRLHRTVSVKWLQRLKKYF